MQTAGNAEPWCFFIVSLNKPLYQWFDTHVQAIINPCHNEIILGK